MNKLVRSLLSGASLVTLQLCAVSAARAAGTTINAARGAFTNAAGNSLDYIEVTNTGAITGDLTNEGTVDVGAGNGTAIDVQGTISGAIINAATGVIGGTSTGIYIHGATASVAGGIQNAGKILVANTTHTSGSARGTAINYRANSVAAITNSGTLGVKVQVNGTATDYAQANAYGVFEDVNAGGGANGTVSYSGSGAINLSAIAVAASGHARAIAYAESAINQSVSYAGVAKETIANTGSLALSAAAKAIATSRNVTQAKAYAGSVLQQYAQNANTAHGSSIGLTITNSGALSVAAKATAVGETKARAYGRVEDIFTQYAYNADAIAQKITNSGALTLSAAAKATAAVSHSTVQASAEAEDVFYQYASNNNTNGASIAQGITNSGDISIALSAQALRSAAGTGSRYVSAEVRAQDLFSQGAHNVTDVTEAITNSGSITINGKATATGVRSRTEADARVEDLFEQDVNADNSATLSIINSAPITVAMTALSNGPRARAYASIESLAYQDADAGQTVSEQFTNSGVITVGMAAAAVGGHVTAEAQLDGGIKQYGYADTSVAQSIANSGSLIFNLSANAKGTSRATARATAKKLFEQYSENSDSITQSLANSGTVSVGLAVAAVAATGAAVAHVSMTDSPAIKQYAEDSSKIVQSITNSGTLTFNLSANAKGTTNAYANITARKLVEQKADNTHSITESLANSGTISVVMAATAAAAMGGASANVQMTEYPAILQTGYDSSKVVQTITNSGSLSFALSANAKGASGATASVLFNTAISQSGEANSVSQSFANSGSMHIGLDTSAVAAGTGANAFATAKLDYAVRQVAERSGSSGGVSNAALATSNSGTFSLTENAKAVGAHEVTAKAYATDVLFYQNAEGYSNISESFSNTGSILIHQAADASGGDTETKANAEVGEVSFQESGQNYRAGDVAALTTINTGPIAISLSAVAAGSRSIKAHAGVDGIFEQFANAASSATETITNSGSISVLNEAHGSGGTGADVSVYLDAWARQQVRSVIASTLTISNSGKITATNIAVAAGVTYASARAEGNGASQKMISSSGNSPSGHGSWSVNNSGTLDIVSNAKATAGLRLEATASATGVRQISRGVGVTAAFDNSGTINLAAVATGVPGSHAGITATTTDPSTVRANAEGLIVGAQGVSGVFHTSGQTHTIERSAPITLSVSNSGTMNVAATANGNSLSFVNITATAVGVAASAKSEIAYTRVNGQPTSVLYTHRSQQTYGGGMIGGTIDNSGTIAVSAAAPGGYAAANGITVNAGAISAEITNAEGGLISVQASGATAVAVGIAEASLSGGFKYHAMTNLGHTSLARVETGHQTFSKIHGAATSVTGNITNSGTIAVTATDAGGNFGIRPVSDVKARAEGISVNAETMSGDILNAGMIAVTANGTNAVANGIHALATQTAFISTHVYTSKYRGTVTGYQQTHASGTHTLHTTLAGSKFAGMVSNSGTISVAATGTGAKAAGVLIEDAVYDGAFVNTGKIVVSAQGTGASADGVVIDATSLGSGASFQNNDGTISATLNGKRGTAIDVSGAPSALALGLNGGAIYGNVVENAAGNAITVGSGNLLLDGLINPSKAKLGSLTVGANGTLTLANNAAEGNATAYVNSYVQPGTLVINGPADGTSGSIHAAHATLSGAAIVNLDLAGAAYGTDTTYKVVFSDAPLTGTWSGVTANGATTFFSANGVYSTDEADITLTRATFDSIAGLTNNEKSVGSAIETIYETSGLNGPLGKLLGALFNLSPQQFADALETLSGVPAGELAAANQATAQSFMDQINSHLGDPSTGGDTVASLMSGSSVLAANAAPTDVTPAQASTFSGTRVWGGGFQSGNSVDRTASGPAYSSHQSGLLAAVDMPVSPNLLLGIAGSYSTGSLKTENLLGYGTFDAAQIAGYARYADDNGLYAVGSVSYGDFTNKLNRYISIPGFGSGNVHGKFDSSAWGLYGEAGWSFDPSTWALSLTPYAAVSYLDAKSDGYTETGFGAPLAIAGTSSSATSSYLGVKLSTDWQLSTATLTPRLTAAWQHDYTKNAWEMSAAFAAVPTVGFGLNGSDLSRDGAFIDGGITLHIAQQVDVLLDYQGRFTSDRTDNAFMARANVRF